MQNIYNMGGRSFWIHNTGPIGCLPYMLTNFPVEKDEAGCLKSFNEVAQYFNFKLNESIVQLRKDLPLATFIYVDVYSVKYSLFTSPKKYSEPPIISYYTRGVTIRLPFKYNYKVILNLNNCLCMDIQSNHV